MGSIQSKNITKALVCLALFAVFCALGCFQWFLWVPAAGFLAGYIAVDRKYLRCPHCGGVTNLERLFYAKSHIYHCSHCGEIIRIEK